ncbi:outer membrane beta-barrel protein [Flavobacterium commune]|uniref:Outer membrane protein beta-barrel domain-containing protein n=1 Tax=Flavobacterium commune TaxID=1306519 RepID=A0A1D9P781_9FLAO|nr:outer membrane beta-barrel protein [Flavobacterium commune]AOZ98399.1 hypothetical protein BIW12_02540 [Flavobacterium commune]
MKHFFICVIFVLSLKGFSQDFNYGLLIGGNFYDIEIDGPISGGAANSDINLGLFGEYIMNENFGLKLYGIYNTTNEVASYDIPNIGRAFNGVRLKTLQAHLLTKFDVNKEYNKGFYLTGGFRLTSILDKNARDDQELLDDFYKKSNVGVLLGLGINFSKSLSIEVLADRNLTNTLDSENNTAKNYGFYLNLLFDISNLTSKN